MRFPSLSPERAGRRSNGYLADKMFHFTCFTVDPEDDPSVGLINGELAIPGTLLRTKVFDPVVVEVSYCQILTLCGVALRSVC